MPPIAAEPQPCPRLPHRVLLPLLPLLAALAGCAAPAARVAEAPVATAFSCRAEGAAPGPPPRRGRAVPAAQPGLMESISITFDRQNRPVTLSVGVPMRDNFVLEAVPGAAGLFSAGDSYGWRGGQSGGVLTEVASAAQLQCHPGRPAA